MKTNGLLTFLATAMMGSTSGFSTIRPIIQTTFRTTLATTSKPTTTTLYLEDWVADMIDGELHRQGHKTEYENAWMAKNRGAVLQSLNVGGTTAMLDEDRIQEFRQIEKDKRLAKRNPQQYCADRCIATGNCDVYEDL